MIIDTREAKRHADGGDFQQAQLIHTNARKGEHSSKPIKVRTGKRQAPQLGSGGAWGGEEDEEGEEEEEGGQHQQALPLTWPPTPAAPTAAAVAAAGTAWSS